jgi:hypothetical protein
MDYYELTVEDLKQEQWLPVSGFERCYEISNMGRVKSLYKAGLIMKPAITNKGYCIVALSVNDQLSHWLVHRLVAIHFIPNPDPAVYNIVNHKKGNKTDNRHHQIEWSTYSLNNKHAFDIGLKVGAYKGKFGKDHNRSIGVVAIQGNSVLQFESRTECGKYLGTTNRLVCKALKFGWNCKGHKLYSI